MTTPHVRSEMRRVYISARGTKLTKHAAYIAAAKHLILKRCHAWDAARLAAVTSTDAQGNEAVSESYEPCEKGGRYQCRFHERTEAVYTYYEETDGGMLYYRKVLARLMRFLRFVDETRAPSEPARALRPVTKHNSLVNGSSARRWTDARWTDLLIERAWIDGGPSPAGNAGPYLKAPFIMRDDSGCPEDEAVYRVYPRHEHDAPVKRGDGVWCWARGKR